MGVVAYSPGKEQDIVADTGVQFRPGDGINQSPGIRSGNNDGMLTDVVPLHQPVPACLDYLERLTWTDDAYLTRPLLDCPERLPTEVGNFNSVLPLFPSGRQLDVHPTQPCIFCCDKRLGRNNEKVDVTNSRVVTFRSDGPEDVQTHKILAHKQDHTSVYVGNEVTDFGVHRVNHLLNIPGNAEPAPRDKPPLLQLAAELTRS